MREKSGILYLCFLSFRWNTTFPADGFLLKPSNTAQNVKVLYTLDLNKNLRTMLLGFFWRGVQIIFLHLGEWISLHGPAWSGTKSTFSASKHTGNRVAPTQCGFSKNCDTHWLGMLPDVFLSPSFNIRNNNLQSTAALRETRTTA